MALAITNKRPSIGDAVPCLLILDSIAGAICLLLSGEPQVFHSSKGARRACLDPCLGKSLRCPWGRLAVPFPSAPWVLCCAQPELARDLEAGLGGISHGSSLLSLFALCCPMSDNSGELGK